MKAIFAMNSYLNKFVHLKPSHILDLFDKLIAPIMNYGSEVWVLLKQITLSVFIYSFAKKNCQSNSAPRMTLYMQNLVDAIFNLLVSVTL